jgi:hypothetical protein
MARGLETMAVWLSISKRIGLFVSILGIYIGIFGGAEGATKLIGLIWG